MRVVEWEEESNEERLFLSVTRESLESKSRFFPGILRRNEKWQTFAAARAAFYFILFNYNSLQTISRSVRYPFHLQKAILKAIRRKMCVRVPFLPFFTSLPYSFLSLFLT